MYVHTYVRTYVCTYVRMYICKYVHTLVQNFLIESVYLYYFKIVFSDRLTQSVLLFVHTPHTPLYKYSGRMRCAQLWTAHIDRQKVTQMTGDRAIEIDGETEIQTDGKTDKHIIVFQSRNTKCLAFCI